METLILSVAFFFAALLYSSVGHAGASAYLAAMGIVGISAQTMRPTALAMNILVSTLVIYRFNKANLVNWKKILPFIAGSIPAAFIGGSLTLNTAAYSTIVGIVLLFVAAGLFFNANVVEKQRFKLSLPVAVLAGSSLGLLSGLTGTGGGIFLTPLLIFAGWASAKQAAGLSAVFIFANSTSGLLGNLTSFQYLPPQLPIWLTVVVLGALLGSYFGANRLPNPALKRALALVLIIASFKLIFL
ncbi:MAG: sulfite exporter TauE/SafE family protein [Candidatus Nanopelagicales bacterium]